MKKRVSIWMLRVLVLCSVGVLIKYLHLDPTLLGKVTQ